MWSMWVLMPARAHACNHSGLEIRFGGCYVAHNVIPRLWCWTSLWVPRSKIRTWGNLQTSRYSQHCHRTQERNMLAFCRTYAWMNVFCFLWMTSLRSRWHWVDFLFPFGCFGFGLRGIALGWNYNRMVENWGDPRRVKINNTLNSSLLTAWNLQ